MTVRLKSTTGGPLITLPHLSFLAPVVKILQIISSSIFQGVVVRCPRRVFGNLARGSSRFLSPDFDCPLPTVRRLSRVDGVQFLTPRGLCLCSLCVGSRGSRGIGLAVVGARLMLSFCFLSDLSYVSRTGPTAWCTCWARSDRLGVTHLDQRVSDRADVGHPRRLSRRNDWIDA